MTRRRVSRTIPELVASGGLVVLGIVLLGGAVRAAPDGWSLVGAVSGELRGATNPRLLPGNGEDADLRATARLNATLTRASPTANLSLTGGISPVLAKEAPRDVIGFLAPSLGGRLLIEGKRTQLTAGLRGSLTSTAFTDTLFGFDEEGNPDLTDPTLVTGTAIRAALNANAGLRWEATSRDVFAFSLNAARIDFFDGAVNLVPTTSAGLGGTWTRALTPRLNGTLGLGLAWFEADSAANPTSVTATANGSLAWAFGPRLSANAGLGIALTRSTEGTPAQTDITAGLTGNLGLTWTGPDHALTAFLTQGVQPSTLGSLQNTTAFGLRYTYAINTVSSLGFDARFQLQTPVGGGGNESFALRLGPSYTHQLDADTSLRLGYSFEMTDQSGGTASSHAVFLTLTRGFNLLQ